MILPDHEIQKYVAKGALGITPFNPAQIQPASYDMRLGNFFRFYDHRHAIDVASPERRTTLIDAEDGPFTIRGREFVLASTIEKVRIPAELVGRCDGKSSLARMGLVIHVTAGFIDPGFEGHLTLELFNCNDLPIILYPGMKICQMSFEKLHSAAERPYGHGATGSKYADQPDGPVESQYFRNYADG